jgi:hypothetical protein
MQKGRAEYLEHHVEEIAVEALDLSGGVRHSSKPSSHLAGGEVSLLVGASCPFLRISETS